MYIGTLRDYALPDLRLGIGGPTGFGYQSEDIARERSKRVALTLFSIGAASPLQRGRLAVIICRSGGVSETGYLPLRSFSITSKVESIDSQTDCLTRSRILSKLDYDGPPSWQTSD
jgi:hypothetical protein